MALERVFYASGITGYVPDASNVYCENCKELRDMDCCDTVEFRDGTKHWKLECCVCRMVQSGAFDPNVLDK